MLAYLLMGDSVAGTGGIQGQLHTTGFAFGRGCLTPHSQSSPWPANSAGGTGQGHRLDSLGPAGGRGGSSDPTLSPHPSPFHSFSSRGTAVQNQVPLQCPQRMSTWCLGWF